MIIAITDKIANFVKKILDKIYLTIKEIFVIVGTIGTIILMLYTIAQPNFFTLIISLFIWGYYEDNYWIYFLGVLLFPLMILAISKS